MFNKLCLFAAIVSPLASALTLQAPTDATSGGQITIKWASDAGDPDTWSFELFNTVFHDSFAIANNVDPAPQQLTLMLPVVPARDGYTLEAVNIGNISDIYATSPSFTVGPASSSSRSSGASTATTPVVTPRSTTSTTHLSTVVVRSSTAVDANPSSTSTASSSIPTAAASGASRRLDFSIGGIAAVVFAIGGAAVLSL